MSLLAKGFGVTAQGFARPSLQEVLDDVHEDLVGAFGPSLRLDATAVLGGQVAGIVAAARYEDWQMAEAVYHSQDPRQAVGPAMDGVAAQTLTSRRPARASTGLVILTGNAGAQAFVLDQVRSPDGALRYGLLEEATLATATAHATETAVAAGEVRRSGGRIYYALTAGTTGEDSAPTGTDGLPTTYTDGTVVWMHCGEGEAYAAVPISSMDLGPIGGPAGGLTTIGTPRVGWLGVVNPHDVTLGRSRDNDEQLRVRRVSRLHGTAKAAGNAVRAGLLDLDEVDEAVVFENTTGEEDADGLPGHSVEAVVLADPGSAVDEIIAARLFSLVAKGIATHGTTEVQHTDDQGHVHPIRFTRKADVEVYCKVTVRADKSLWPSGGADTAEALVLAYGAKIPMGRDVRHSAVGAAVFGDPDAPHIPGTLGVSVQLDTVEITVQPPADVVIGPRQLGKLDTARTDVAVIFEEP